MKYTDIAIIGGGLAGSTAAAMLGRARIPAVLIDPHQAYPFDFRVEKISGDRQLDHFYQTGIANSVLRSATHDGENWIARFGHLLDRKPSRQYGIMYDALIAAVRGRNRGPCRTHLRQGDRCLDQRRAAKAHAVERRNHLGAAGGAGHGLSVGLRHKLGVERQVLSANHSISIGFDMAPLGRPAFEFPALTYFSEWTKERVAYVTLFPIENRMRANLFVYREVDDPWLREMRKNPVETMNAALPRPAPHHRRLRRNRRRQDPARRYLRLDRLSTGGRRSGRRRLSATCPVTGPAPTRCSPTSPSSATSDIPAWLATEGMGAEKIASFYDDPVKQACDAWSIAKGISFRKVSIENGLYWRAQRWARFLAWLGEGACDGCATGSAQAQAVALTPRRLHRHFRRRPDRPVAHVVVQCLSRSRAGLRPEPALPVQESRLPVRISNHQGHHNGVRCQDASPFSFVQCRGSALSRSVALRRSPLR